MAVDEATEKTARAAAEELIRNVKAGGCVDEHLQDQVRGLVDVLNKREREHVPFFFQLIILMALAKGRSVLRSGSVTLHTQTAIHLAEMMTKVCNMIGIHIPIRGAA